MATSSAYFQLQSSSSISVINNGALTATASTPNQPIDGGTITIDATTTAPTKGTVSKDQITYVDDGSTVIMTMQYYQTTAGTVGSGDYLFTLPNNLQFDTTVQPVTTSSNNTNYSSHFIDAWGFITASGFRANMYVIPYNSTQFRISTQRNDTPTQEIFRSGYLGMAQPSLAFTLRFKFKKA